MSLRLLCSALDCGRRAVAWLIAGVLYGAWRTSFFRKPLQFAPIESDDSSAETVAATKAEPTQP